LPDSEPQTVQLAANRYTNYAIPDIFKKIINMQNFINFPFVSASFGHTAKIFMALTLALLMARKLKLQIRTDFGSTVFTKGVQKETELFK
jgi:hypothetical protein